MSVTLDGIYVDGQKAKFRPEDILTGDASAYTEEIGTAVNAWMEENVTGGEQVTDTTLTLPGVPADSKVTGDEIEALKAISAFEGLKWTLQKSINDSGVINSNPTTALTDIVDCSAGDFIVCKNAVKDNNNNIYFVGQIALFKNENGIYTFLERQLFTSGISIEIPSNVNAFRLLFGRTYSTGVTITSEDIEEYVNYEIYQKGASVGRILKLEDEVADVLHLSYDKSTDIDSNSDFNDYVTVGNYRVPSASIASTIENIPEIASGSLKVLTTVSSIRITQIYITNTENSSIWIRNKINSWGDWNKVGWSDYGVETAYDSVGAVVDIAESYFNVAYDKSDNLVYSSTHGLFTDLVDSEDKKAIVCSQFEQACIGGISYQNSRYVLGYSKPNKPYWWGWQSDGGGVYYNTGEAWYDYAKDYMRASEQFAYFQRKGIVHEFSSDHNDLKPGDLLFFLLSVFNENVEQDYVSHVGICLRAYRDRYTMIHSDDNHARLVDGAEAGVRDAHWAYSNKAPSYYVHLDDIPIIKAKTKSALIAKKLLNVSGTYESSTIYIGNVTFQQNLERGFYTVNIETGGDCDGYIRLYYDETDVEAGITIPTQYKYGGNIGGKTSIVFYSELPLTKIDVRVSGQSGDAYNVQNCYVYKGYHSPDD